jgi:hypothetical protein
MPVTPIPVFNKGLRLVDIVLPAYEHRWLVRKGLQQALANQPAPPAQVSCREPLPGARELNSKECRKGRGNSWKAHRLTQWR